MSNPRNNAGPAQISVYRDILANWDLDFSRLRDDLAIPGSPERCLFRHVLEDRDGGSWLLEQLAPGQSQRREAIGRLLDALAGRGLAGLAPYRRTGGGSFVCRDWGHCWQISPFIPGLPLAQPAYLDNSAMGGSLGVWLGAFRRASEGLDVPAGLFELDLPTYVTELLYRLARPIQDTPAPDMAAVHARASRLLPVLAPLLEAGPELPRVLCHGDVHPLNVVWGRSNLKAVIDWEFAGMRPVLYDLANCLGCLGIEGGGFDTPFARALLARARSDGLLPDDQAKWLVSMILATRFGWLSEWLRRRDEEMIGLELEWMEQLAERPMTVPA